MGNLTEPQLTQPDLAARMKVYVEGQANWPLLETRNRCKGCAFFEAVGKHKVKGHCSKRRELNSRAKATKPYVGSDAIACRYFTEV